MARRSLKPQLNQIRAWVRQGRTDAWIAHQLEVTAAELRAFREEHDLSAEDEDGHSQETDLRDEIEAEVQAATTEESVREEVEEEDAEDAVEADEAIEAEEEADEAEAGEPEEQGPAGETRPRRRRRRGRRGGRGRRKELEATFDHGERDGYGLWLDPAVKDNPVYAEHWAGRREVSVRIDPDQIVIRRAGDAEPDDSDE